MKGSNPLTTPLTTAPFKRTTREVEIKMSMLVWEDCKKKRYYS